jgi:outer membrane biosynthesis protein TonB
MAFIYENLEQGRFGAAFFLGRGKIRIIRNLFHLRCGVGTRMRFVSSIGVVMILLAVSLSWGQEAPRPFNRRDRHQPTQQPQNPTDFAPDPPPVSVPTPTPTPTPTPAPQPAVSQVPAQVTPPEQLPPATPPQVTYRDGLLTVVANNSSLGALLNAIRNKAGIQFEGLENGASERIAIDIGPAPEGEVLTAILGGSSFDYVVLERPDSPGIVQRVVLSPKAGTAAAAASNTVQPARNAADSEDEEDASEEPVAPQDTPVRPPLAQLPPQPEPMPQPQQPRTAEQMLEDIKRLQQQQQNQQQQNSAPNSAPIKPPPNL